MHKINLSSYWLPLFIILSLTACKNKLNPEQPYGAAGQNGNTGNFIADDSTNKQQVLGRLVGAYAVLGYLDSNYSALNGFWAIAPDNWVYGSVCGGDSHKGSDPGDQPTMVPLEMHNANADNSYLNDVWNVRFTGIRLANSVLRGMRIATDMNSDDTTEAGAEARFIRGYYHFELKKIFGNIPFVDEYAPVRGDTITTPNTLSAWPYIEADFKYAYNKLPETQVALGRINKWGAAAYLAKAYVYQHKWAEALALFHTIIAQGKNAQGLKYALLPNFADNFNPAKNHVNDPELVFAVEYTVNDGSGGAHANQGDILNFPYGGGPGNCCSFNQPSFSLVNAYKVDNNTGLPLIDTYNSTDLKNDQGIASSSSFVPDGATAVDPRLDWTVGRRGIPYLNWGAMPGQNWVRNQAYSGPYLPIKNTFYQGQENTYTEVSGWTTGYTANNTMLMRYADLLLMAAEAEVEAGSLDNAQQLVNRVRGRMASPTSWVQGSPAKYKIGLYPAGDFAGKGQVYARRSVQFERRLELAMEGHRFFDLVRYGIAAAEMNAYMAHESNVSHLVIFNGANFTAGMDELFPIPQLAIAKSGVLVQNPGY